MGATVQRTMIGASLLLLLLSSVTGEDYIINQEDPDWAVVKDGANEYPWVVEIDMGCTGTLISPDRIATAKHCFENVESAVVRFFKKTKRDQGRFQRNIKYYEIPSNRNSDYAEAVLDRPVVHPAPIDICQEKPKVDEMGLAVGWGMVDHGEWGTYLRRARLQIIRYDNPGEYFWTRVKYGKNNNIIKDPCGGDSGGPILAERNNKSCIFGTVFGNGYDCRTDRFNDIGGKWNDMLSMREKLNKKIEMKIENSMSMKCDSEKTRRSGLDQNRVCGEVTSPNYPDKYPNNFKNKMKTIEVEKGSEITLSFTAFKVEWDSWDSSCPYDHLTIEDGDGSTLMEKTCGSSLPENLVSKSNVVKLYFTTDDSVAESGWSLTWCEKKQSDGCTGVVTSPNYPDKYPNDLQNTTTIEVEKGMIIALKFTAFDVEPSESDSPGSTSSCYYDHLTIKDGDESTLMEKTCGNALPQGLVSKSNVVKLHFKTDESVAESGWSVTWSAEKPTGE